MRAVQAARGLHGVEQALDTLKHQGLPPELLERCEEWYHKSREGREVESQDAPPPPPPGMTPPEKVTEAMKGRQRRDPQQWTMSVEQWFSVLQHCRTTPSYMSLKERGRGAVSMYQVNECFVVPWSKGTGCGLSVLMSGAMSKDAQIMLSHAWAEDAEELEQSVAAYIEEHRIPRSATIWFCVFSNYQPEDGAGPSISEQLKLNPFASVISCEALRVDIGGYGMLAVHTTQGDLYCRLWCVHEMERALAHDGVPVAAAMSMPYLQNMRDRIEFFHSHGASAEECLEAAGVMVNTIKARCSRDSDEKLLIKQVLETCGSFHVLDKVISKFRRSMIPLEVMRRLMQNGLALADASLAARSDKPCVLAAVSRDSQAFEIASKELQKDPDVLAAFRKTSVLDKWSSFDGYYILVEAFPWCMLMEVRFEVGVLLLSAVRFVVHQDRRQVRTVPICTLQLQQLSAEGDDEVELSWHAFSIEQEAKGPTLGSVVALPDHIASVMPEGELFELSTQVVPRWIRATHGFSLRGRGDSGMKGKAETNKATSYESWQMDTKVTMDNVTDQSVLMIQELLKKHGSISLCRVSSPSDEILSGPDVPKLASGLYVASYSIYGQFQHEVVRLHYRRYYLNEVRDLLQRPFEQPQLPDELAHALDGDEETAFGFLVTRKVTGDVHVPAGMVTFMALCSPESARQRLASRLRIQTFEKVRADSGNVETVVQQWPGFTTFAYPGFKRSSWRPSYLMQFLDAQDGRNRFAFLNQESQPASVLEQLPDSFSVGRQKSTSAVTKPASHGGAEVSP